MKTLALALTISMFSAAGSPAAEKPDYTTVQGMMKELYASIDRPPESPFSGTAFERCSFPARP